MLTVRELYRVMGAEVYDATGERLGRVKNVYVDEHTSEAAFLSVHGGAVGRYQSLVPASGALLQDDKVKLPYVKDEVTNAPAFESIRGQIEPAKQRQILEHYGLPPDW